jgi:uncharacterized protein
MVRLSRRHFLRQVAASGSAIAAAPLLSFYAPDASAGNGPRVAPATAAGPAELVLEIPPEFDCRVIGREAASLFGGLGAGALKKNQLRLVRNHGSTQPQAESVADMMHAYDPLGGGGTTTIQIDPATGSVVRQFVSLSGTANNSGGGITPWKSWITCEATTRGVSSGYTQPHGYCFEVPLELDRGVIPVPLKSMGRFVHASVCIDPESGSAYLTEHSSSGAGLYRWQPRRAKSLAAGGRLQMLAIAQQPKQDFRRGGEQRPPLAVTWVEIAEADPAEAENNPAAVFEQGRARGGAAFLRLGGIAYDDGAVFFTAAAADEAESFEQVWEYRIRASRRRPASSGERVGMLRLVSETGSASAVRVAPELCVSPRGPLLVAQRGVEAPELRVVTRDGTVSTLARAAARGGAAPRFGGAAFSPDGSTLFVNQQTPGVTIAIRGPWTSAGL